MFAKVLNYFLVHMKDAPAEEILHPKYKIQKIQGGYIRRSLNM